MKYTLPFLLLLAACSSPKDPVEQIKTLEEVAFAGTGDELDTAIARRLVNAYDAAAEEQPESPDRAGWMFKSAEVEMNRPGRSLHAVEKFLRFKNTYTEHPKAPEAAFLVGMIFDGMGDKARATKAFSGFLEEYPGHPLAKDAKALLEMNSPEADELSLVKSWLEKDTTQSKP